MDLKTSEIGFDMKHEGIEELYKLLNFCFNNLNNAQKNCFRYGALYSEDIDIPIECLLECWAAKHFLGSTDDADKQRIHSRSILQHLKHVPLFEEGANMKYVRIKGCTKLSGRWLCMIVLINIW